MRAVGRSASVVVAAVGCAVLMLSGCAASDGTLVADAPAGPGTSIALTTSCPPRTAAGHLALDIAGFAYCPATLTVAVGDEVVWKNADLAPHTVTYDTPDGPVDSGSMAQGQAWSTRFRHPGTYQYYCRFHPGMTGTIVVDSSR